MSPLASDGRVAPRWSVADAQSLESGATLSNASPFVAIAIVFVGPPLSWSGPSFGSPTVPGHPADAGVTRLPPPSPTLEHGPSAIELARLKVAPTVSRRSEPAPAAPAVAPSPPV